MDKFWRFENRSSGIVMDAGSLVDLLNLARTRFELVIPFDLEFKLLSEGYVEDVLRDVHGEDVEIVIRKIVRE